jgi:O-antigen/teichoic acid export membrane protein
VASDVASMPVLAFFGPVLRPLLAGFSHAQGDQERLRQSYIAASQAIVAIGLPILVGECLVSEPTVELVLGTKWLNAAPLVSWLAISLIPALLAMPAGSLVMSYGQTQLFVIRNAIELSVRLPVAILGTLQFGFGGVIVARFASETIASLYSVSVVKRLTGLTAWVQLGGSWRSAAASLAMVPAVEAVLAMVHGAAPGERLLAAAGVGAGVYAAGLWLLWRLSGRPQGCERAAAAIIAAGLRRWQRSARGGRILDHGKRPASLGSEP